jgi:hypothetical protein
MALFDERTDRYAQKLLDTADIVREAMLGQLPTEQLDERSVLIRRL